MAFDLNGKIALVTGGASGIGLALVKELLRSDVKGVTLADQNSDLAETVLVEIEKEFGPNRALFVKTDVSDVQQFENAFKKTIEKFKYVDILINNAGIGGENAWEKLIAVNFTGVLHGLILGIDKYLPKYKQGPEAVIVNTASIIGLGSYPGIPVYGGTKAAVLAMTRCWGNPYHYDRTKVKVFAICPGFTKTPLVTETRSNQFLGQAYEDWARASLFKLPPQTVEHVAQETRRLFQTCPNGSIWVIEGGQPAYQYIMPNKEEMLK